MWKDIPEWEKYYEVNDKGDVRSKRTGKYIIGDKNNMGYSRVTFYDGDRKERIFRHRLVAQTFIPNPNEYEEVNHIDENKSNNSVSNLEWCTRTMNERANHHSNGKEYTPFVVWFNDGHIKHYRFAIDLARELGVSSSLVHHWLNVRTHSYRNYGIKVICYD